MLYNQSVGCFMLHLILNASCHCYNCFWSSCCCWLMWCVLRFSSHLIWFKWWKNPTINEACIRSFVQHSVVWFGLKQPLNTMRMANTSIHSAGNYTHRMLDALELYPNGWFRVIKQMTKHRSIVHISILVMYIVRNGDSLVRCAVRIMDYELLCTM